MDERVVREDQAPAVAETDGGVYVVGGARRRRRAVVARGHQVAPRFSEEEFAVLVAAAAGSGLTVTGFVASRALAHARGEVAPLPSSAADAVRELVGGRTMLRRYASLLNQSVAKLNATGTADAGLGAAVARCEAATAAMDEAAERLGRGR